MQHIENVIKSQKHQICGGFIAEAIDLWHLGHEDRVCWIFHFKKFQLCCQNTIMEHPDIPSDVSEPFLGIDRSTQNMQTVHRILGTCWPVAKPDRLQSRWLAAGGMGTALLQIWSRRRLACGCIVTLLISFPCLLRLQRDTSFGQRFTSSPN